MRLFLILGFVCFNSILAFSQVTINVDFNTVGRSYSPYIFGKNNALSDNPEKPLSYSDWIRVKDSGITIFRENGGNNSTKYNWKRKLSSHPDWYNNVYAHDWDFVAKSIEDILPGRQGIFGLQVLGKVAKTNEYNFNEWEYNQAAWWEGVHQNLAGGGEVDPSGGSEALKDGDPELYLVDWPADSTVAIFNHWFNDNELDLNQDQFVYWCMDNEPSIWNHTHDDVAGNEPTPEQYMQKYFEVAKAARASFPGVKLIGPIAANEWQWYNWHNQRINYNNKSYCFLEYFILRVAEEQQVTGIRLLDVLSIHFYPGNANIEDVVQFHRIYFDEDYEYPDANGVKAVNGGWDDSINKEYIFKRSLDWMQQYMGEDHNVGLGMTETGVAITDPNGIAVWYASTLGEFMKENVEIFTPWSWQPPMWEVINLFTEHANEIYFESVSSKEEMVSAYITVDEGKDNVTSILVNRSTNSNQKVTVKFEGVFIDTESIKSYELSDLGNNESFFSNTENALKESTVTPGYRSFSIDLPALSLVAVTFKSTDIIPTGLTERDISEIAFKVYPNPTNGNLINIETGQLKVDQLRIYDQNARHVITITDPVKTHDHKLVFNTIDLPEGLYLKKAVSEQNIFERKIIVE